MELQWPCSPWVGLWVFGFKGLGFRVLGVGFRVLFLVWGLGVILGRGFGGFRASRTCGFCMGLWRAAARIC